MDTFFTVLFAVQGADSKFPLFVEAVALSVVSY